MTARVAAPAPATTSARRARSRVGPRRPRHLVAWLFVTAVVAFLFVPLAVVVVFSFNDIPRLSLPITGMSLRWYEQAYGDPEVRQALQRSVVAAILTALVAAPLGILAALGLRALSDRWRTSAMAVLLLPIAVPGLLFAVGLAVYWRGWLGLPYSLGAAVLGHILLALPFVILTMNAAVSTFRFSLLEAARDLGASPWRAFRDVLFPLIRPAVEGAALLSAAISLDEFIVTLFVGGRETTLPVLLWGRVQRSMDPSLNALATTLLVATTILALLAARRASVRL
jgi:ABC-type spermidine/putrescine transport system permease subunit II